jgi:hypothetical protein
MPSVMAMNAKKNTIATALGSPMRVATVGAGVTCVA